MSLGPRRRRDPFRAQREAPEIQRELGGDALIDDARAPLLDREQSDRRRERPGRRALLRPDGAGLAAPFAAGGRSARIAIAPWLSRSIRIHGASRSRCATATRPGHSTSRPVAAARSTRNTVRSPSRTSTCASAARPRTVTGAPSAGIATARSRSVHALSRTGIRR